MPPRDTTPPSPGLRTASPRFPRPRRPKALLDPTKLVREAGGVYATGDGRFSVEKAFGGWMVSDAARTNELGLALLAGPYATLDAARSAVDVARRGPAPISNLSDRIAAIPKSDPRSRGRATAGLIGPTGGVKPLGSALPLPVVLREFRSRDGEALRALWALVGFRSVGDDDMSLRRFAQRNPALFRVACQGSVVIGSAMGGWDGRQGWMYHVVVAETHRRTGIGTRLVREVEVGLLAVGCPTVNVIVQDGNDTAVALWEAMGYEAHAARQFGRDLSPDPARS